MGTVQSDEAVMDVLKQIRMEGFNEGVRSCATKDDVVTEEAVKEVLNYQVAITKKEILTALRSTNNKKYAMGNSELGLILKKMLKKSEIQKRTVDNRKTGYILVTKTKKKST